MSRLLALVAAVALVAGAFVLRDWLDARGSPSVSTDDGPTEPSGATLICAADLRAACERLDDADITVRIEEAGTTIEALVNDPDNEPDLWLVPAPMPELAALRRGVDALAGAEVSEAIARSPLVFAGFTDRFEALERTACGGQVTWRCLGEQAGTPWTALGLEDAGTAVLRPGHLDPTLSATGLLVAGSAVSSFAGRTNLSRNDLDSPNFAAWFSRLETTIPEFRPASGSQVADMLTRGPASYDIVGTTEAEANRLLEVAPSGPRSIETRASEPTATADVVLVAFDAEVEAALDRLGEPLRTALADTGWQVADSASLPEDAGLPSAGFLIALQERWEEVAR